jgi:hypothetical protein
MADYTLEAMELELAEIQQMRKIAEYKAKKESENPTNEKDSFGFDVVQSGSGKAVIMPNGIRLSKSKCVPYTSIKILEDGTITNGKKDFPIKLSDLQKFYGLLDSFPKSGEKDRAVWCDKHFGKQFTYDAIIYNLFIGTFNEWISEPILIIGD